MLRVTVAATAKAMSGSGRSVPRPTESNVHALSKPAPSMLRAASARLAAPKGGPPARPVGREMPNRVMEYGGHHNTAGWSILAMARPEALLLPKGATSRYIRPSRGVDPSCGRIRGAVVIL